MDAKFQAVGAGGLGLNRLSQPLSRMDWLWLIFGCGLSIEIANLVLLGWSHGLYPVIKRPYLYAGDALFYQAAAQRALEGWVYNNPRMGFPFGSAWYDFPNSDAGNFLVFKIIGSLTGSSIAATNLHFLLSFPAVFAASFTVIRRFEIRREYAACFALIFTFAPYHFARYFYGHTPYTWYFCVPLLFYYGYRLYGAPRLFVRSWQGAAKAILIAAALASFGVYFAFFGVIMLMLCGLAGMVKRGTCRPLLTAAAMSGLITVGVIANLAPVIVDKLEHGVNAEAVVRSPIETEVYSLKIIHLLLPQPFHRITALGDFTKKYDATFPLSNTNSSLGLIGDIGFFAVLLVGLAMGVGKNVDDRLRFAMIMVFSTILICTVGGLNDLIALFATPLIRGWDRFSIFVNFGVLLSLAILFEKHVTFSKVGWRSRYAAFSVMSAIALLGIVDQTPSSYRFWVDSAFARYDADVDFVRQVEASLPKGAAVYQLPYVQFPEVADTNRLGGYDLLTGFVTSKSLRWSFGGIKGREGDLFFRKMATKLPIEQIAMARKMGFSGIYIDKRGYGDGGVAIAKSFADVLGQPLLTRDDGNIVFFRLR